MEVYTVGHSNLEITEFLEILKTHSINLILDVRSIPYSNYNPQYNKETIEKTLIENGILYKHFGVEFGARRRESVKNRYIVKNRKKVEIQQVDFLEAMKEPKFLEGVKKLENAVKFGLRVCLMCSESNPLDCHRFSFLGRFLTENGWKVSHILNIENVKSQNECLSLLIKQYCTRKNPKLTIPVNHIDFITGRIYTEKDQQNDAYSIKNGEIGWEWNPIKNNWSFYC